jgi:hypothetical protein
MEASLWVSDADMLRFPDTTQEMKPADLRPAFCAIYRYEKNGLTLRISSQKSFK